MYQKLQTALNTVNNLRAAIKAVIDKESAVAAAELPYGSRRKSGTRVKGEQGEEEKGQPEAAPRVSEQHFKPFFAISGMNQQVVTDHLGRDRPM